MLPFFARGAWARPRPYATFAVAALCILLSLYVLGLREDPPALFCTDLEEDGQARAGAAGSVQAFTCRWGAIPDELHEGRDLYTAFTALFVHSGWLHLVTNLAYLLVLGPLVERRLGRRRYLLVLLAAGLLGVAAHVARDPDATEPLVGLSGALAGVLAVHLVAAPFAEVRVLVGPLPMRLPVWFVVGFWLVQQLVLTVLVLRRAEAVGGVAYEAHLAGALLGMLVAVTLRSDVRTASPVPGTQGERKRTGRHRRTRSGHGSSLRRQRASGVPTRIGERSR